MIKSEYRIGKVWGIPIKIHISMLALLAFMVIRSLGKTHSFLDAIVSMLLVVLIGILLFTSIALHELGHSFVAIHKGCRVYEITLMFMGGAAKMDKMPSRPLDEFLMAIAGPAVSLILGMIGLGGSMLIHQANGALGFFGVLLFALGFANTVLAVFNLVPAFPMDGGRVFRALLTPRYGRTKATYIASRLGRAIAVAFFIIGIFGIKNFTPFGVPMFASGNPVLIIIAIFIFINADREFRMVQYEELMKQRNSSGNPGANFWSSIFGNMQPPTQQPPPVETQVDDTVYISPPPYEKGPAEHTDLHHTNETKKNPLKSFFGR